MTIEYRLGRLNAVANSLSRKGQLVALEEGENRAECSRIQVYMTDKMQNRLRASVENDTREKSILKQVKEGNTRNFFLQDGLLFYGNQIYILKSSRLRRHLLNECHDSPWVGLPGKHRSLALLEKGYFWEKMQENVEEYMHTRIIC